MRHLPIVVFAFALAGPAAAQVPTARSVAEAVRAIVHDDYVVAATRDRLDAMLAANITAGRYDRLDADALARTLSADMATVAHDKHLGLRFDPGMAAHMPAPQRDDAVPSDPFWQRFARAHNHGVTRLEVLDGNVRKLTLDGFVLTGDESRTALDQAVAFLAGGDAAIIDLRGNGGGDPEAVRYLASHFVAPGTTLVTFHLRNAAPSTSISLRTAGPAWGKTPLYVLTSRRSASAAEEFAAHAARLRFATLVGEPTAGAAYRNELYPIAGRYVLSVSIGYPELPGGGNWEGKGVPPSLAVPADQAETAALADAYRRLARNGESDEAKVNLWRAAAQQAILTPAIPALPLASYTGRYADERSVRLIDGALVSRRGGGPESRLLPLAPNRFALAGDPATQIRFTETGGRVTAMTVERVSGETEQAAKLD